MKPFEPPRGPGRCPVCGFDVASQAHRPGCSWRATRAEQRALAAAQRRAAIDRCDRCDDLGMVGVAADAVRRCDHRLVGRDWLTEAEERRDVIAERLAELGNNDRG